MSSSDECDSNTTTPETTTINENLLPEKSKERYIAAYEQFTKWRNDKNTSSCSEDVLMAYFKELSIKYKPTSLWSTYSMLKPTLQSKDCVNIKEYTKLTAFLKKQSDGYVSQKSKVLTRDNVKKFIDEAPDEKYLATKVALIFGITGACRRQELSEITTNDIENHGDMLLIKIPHDKDKISRSFVVHGKYYKIVKKYESLRTKKGNSSRFFQQFRNGKCTAQVIGRNKFGNMPKEIAQYLNLPDSNSYTGHSFRRTSARLLADSGDDGMTVRRDGGWKSSYVTEGYDEDSDSKETIDDDIAKSIDPEPSTSFVDFELEPCASTSSATGETRPCASTATVKLERHEGWKSSNDTEEYIEDSLDSKETIGDDIAKSIMKSCYPEPSSSYAVFEPEPCASTSSTTGMDEELLINLVRERRELYDVEHKLYEDNPRREAAWHDIAKKTSQPAHECRDRWKRLRDNYRRAKKLRAIKKRQGATKLKPIKHEKIMAFIDPIIENNRSDLTDFIDDTEAGSSIMFHEKQENISDVSLDPLTVLERPYLDDAANKCDTVVAFFTNLGETVKTFPEAVQIRVKRDIFKIINEAEEDVLRMRQCS